MSGRTPNELLRTAAGVSNYRDAELAFARWLTAPDLNAAKRLVDDLTPAQSRRMGYSLSVAVAAKLLARSDVADVLSALGKKVGVEYRPGVLRDLWRPDMAFEVTRLKQRTAESKRRAV